MLRSTVFVTVFLAGIWVTPTLLARQFGTNPQADFRASSRAEPRLITRDDALSWATAKTMTQSVVANPYVPDGPKGTSYRETLRTSTYEVTIWDLPGTAPDLNAVLLRFAARNRTPGGEEVEDRQVAGLDARWLGGSFDVGLPTARDVDAIAMVVPKADGMPARLVLITRTYPSTAKTIGGLTPSEASAASVDELRGILASFQRS